MAEGTFGIKCNRPEIARKVGGLNLEPTKTCGKSEQDNYLPVLQIDIFSYLLNICLEKRLGANHHSANNKALHYPEPIFFLRQFSVCCEGLSPPSKGFSIYSFQPMHNSPERIIGIKISNPL